MPEEGPESGKDDDEDQAEVPLEELEDLEHHDKETGSGPGKRAPPSDTSRPSLKPDDVEGSATPKAVVRGLDKSHRLERGRQTEAYTNARPGDQPSDTGPETKATGQAPRRPPSGPSESSEVTAAFDHGDVRRPYTIGATPNSSRGVDRILTLLALAVAVSALGAAVVLHGPSPSGSALVLFAAVDSNGTVAEQRHVASVSISSSTGDYNVTFDRNVSSCTYQANPGQWPGSGTPAASTLPYRTAADPASVFVHTGGAGAFYLSVSC